VFESDFEGGKGFGKSMNMKGNEEYSYKRG
jgi:hypothetical protein